MVTVSEGGCYSRLSMALRRPITSSIDSSKKSSNISIMMATCEYFFGDDVEKFLDGSLLIDVVVAVPRQLLH